MTLSKGWVLFLAKYDVERVLTMKKTLQAVQQVFRFIDEGKVKQNFGESLETVSDPENRTFFTGASAFVEPLGIVGNKWAGGGPGNTNKGLPHLYGAITLNEPDTGMPFAIVDAMSITTMRTGAHGAVGAMYLAQEDSRIVAIIGCGAEGRSHLKALNEIFRIEQVRAHCRSEQSLNKFANEMSEKLKLDVVGFRNVREAVHGADIICMVTTSRKPLVVDEDVGPGAHVVGCTGFSDVDPKLSRTASKWAIGNWDRDSTWFDRYGVSRSNVYATYSELATGKKVGRERSEERTLSTHLGMPSLDVATAYEAYQAALKEGIGTKLRIL